MTHDPLSQTAPHLGHRLLVPAALRLAISIAVVFLGALFGAARGLTRILHPDRSSLRR